jgi:hypothetical protein
VNGGKEVVATAAAVAMAATAVAVQSPSKGDHRSWLLSRMIFGFVVLGMAITALNVWHLFTIVSSVIEVVQQRNDLSSNGHLESPQSRSQQQRPQQQQQPRRVYSPYPPRYHTHPSRYQFVRELYQQWQQQQQQHDSYYYQQNQAWVSDEDFKAWNQQASFHGSDVEDQQQGSPFPAPEASPMTSPPTSDESWEQQQQQQQQQQQGDEAKEPTLPLNLPLETVQLQKEQLKAEIAELLAMLEHARKEVRS